MNKVAVITYTKNSFHILAVINKYLGHDNQITLFAASICNMYHNDFIFITILTSLCISYHSCSQLLSVSYGLLWAIKSPCFPSLITSPTAYTIVHHINADQDGFLKTYLSREENMVSVFTSLVSVSVHDSVSSLFNICSLPNTLHCISSYILSSLPSPHIPLLHIQSSINEESSREDIV